MARRRKANSPRDLDPHRQREAKKYANPIPSREFILETLTDAGVPLVFEELAAALEKHALGVIDETGVIYDLFSDSWRLSNDMDVNYMMAAQKQQRPR